MNHDPERLRKQMEFSLEIDKEKSITRQNYTADGSRRENDTEHAWHMAVMALILSEYANEPVDLLKTVSMILIHDLVEIDAGDTYAYDEDGKLTQRQRELAAAERIFNILPKDQAARFRELWDEFEERKTPESKFARTLDNIQPAMLNAASGGISWQEHQVRLSSILKRNEISPEGAGALWDYSRENFIMPNVENGIITDDRQDVI
ncbi:MAG: HD domain-containing protein [Lachnospiraceae bacterium]|nr:HD domain-containing protein [Lachnospiraceae bacterium]